MSKNSLRNSSGICDFKFIGEFWPVDSTPSVEIRWYGFNFFYVLKPTNGYY